MLGRGLLGIAIAFSAYSLIAAPASMRRDRVARAWIVVRPELLASARRAMVATALATAGAAGALWYAFFARDFSISYVAAHTSRATQPWYTFSALWSGMEGSLLLWSLVMAVFAAVFVARENAAREAFVPWAIPVLATTQLFYLAITIGPENPFATSEVVPFDGRGLNPLLHSPGMLIHPPVLYVGMVGMAVPFAIVVSALINRRTGADWIRVVRRWMLVPWTALAAGLVLGGAWAYTELGWGGYWDWDPVENAALLPWLAATAFLHSAMVQERRGMLKVWNVLLVIVAAALATFGAFITRSGLLSSVHTFAESPIGRWFFLYLAVQTVGGLALLVWRLPHLRADNNMGSPLSKEAAFLVNNLVIIGATAVVLWGTILPWASEAATGTQIVVGPPFYNRVFAPIGALLLLLATAGTVVPWRSGSVRRLAARLARPALVASAMSAVVLAATRRFDFAGVAFIALFLAVTSVMEIARAARARARLTQRSLGSATAGLFARNPRRYGGFVVHLGLAVMVIGFAGSLGRSQTELVASPGERFTFAGYSFHYESLRRSMEPDKEVNMAFVEIERGNRHIRTLRPQMNFHHNWEQPQAEIAIHSRPTADLYVILAATDPATQEAVFRIHHNPLVFWVWAGAVIVVAGGLIALLARPRRPAPVPTRKEQELQPAEGGER